MISRTTRFTPIPYTTLFRSENFAVTLSNPSNAAIDPAHTSAAGVIRNDEFLLSPSFRVVAESAGVVTFTLSRGAGGPQQTVYLSTAEFDGWKNNNDYTTLSGE